MVVEGIWGWLGRVGHRPGAPHGARVRGGWSPRRWWGGAPGCRCRIEGSPSQAGVGTRRSHVGPGRSRDAAGVKGHARQGGSRNNGGAGKLRGVSGGPSLTPMAALATPAALLLAPWPAGRGEAGRRPRRRRERRRRRRDGDTRAAAGPALRMRLAARLAGAGAEPGAGSSRRWRVPERGRRDCAGSRRAVMTPARWSRPPRRQTASVALATAGPDCGCARC